MGHDWRVYSIQDKYVADYCNMSIREVDELNIVEYWVYARDARIYQLMQTPDGQEYLRNAWRIHEIKPERDKLREQFGKS